MDRVKAMEVFVEVAKREGFVPAARHLGMSTSAVSRHVSDLEGWLGGQLLHRTTRRVNLTDIGKTYLARCSRIVDELAALKRSATELRDNPQGEIRVTAPVFVGTHFLGPLLPKFLERYPNINVRLHLLDRFVNLVDEGFDLALRIADLPDSTLIARRLGDIALVLTAAPAYLESSGVPETPEDLDNHNCLVDLVRERGDRWPLIGRNGPVNLRVAGNFSVNNGEMIREMTLAGVGISLLPDFFVSRDIAQGRLVVLPNTVAEATAGIFAVYPHTRHLSSPVRVLLDFLIAHAADLEAFRDVDGQTNALET